MIRVFLLVIANVETEIYLDNWRHLPFLDQIRLSFVKIRGLFASEELVFQLCAVGFFSFCRFLISLFVEHYAFLF